ALGFVSMFVIGGLSGIYMASTPVDIFIHDTYYIVAHIHYVVFGGSIFGIFAGIYYWFPKMFGRMMNEGLGKLHFWATLVFFNLTFFPMHIIGTGGHMRRIYNPMQYEFLQPMQYINVIITIGALGLGASQLIIVVNFFWSLIAGRRAERQLPGRASHRLPRSVRVLVAAGRGRLPAAGTPTRRSGGRGTLNHASLGLHRATPLRGPDRGGHVRALVPRGSGHEHGIGSRRARL